MAQRTRHLPWLTLAAAVILCCWIFSVSGPGAAVEGYPEGCALASERPDGRLRVMSLNMLHGFPHFERLPDRLDLLAAEIN